MSWAMFVDHFIPFYWMSAQSHKISAIKDLLVRQCLQANLCMSPPKYEGQVFFKLFPLTMCLNLHQYMETYTEC